MNKNLLNIEISGIRRFFNKVKKIDGAISLTLGEPDFETPSEIKLGMIRAIKENKTTYTDNLGILELREEVSKYLLDKNIKYKKEEICITTGGSEALFSSIAAMINPRDKVLIPEIAYPAYENIIKLLGGEVIRYKLKEDFSIDFEELDYILEENKIELMILSYPSNPTGAIIKKEECKQLVDRIKKNDLKVISDEIYESIIYDNYFSVAMNEDIKNNIIYISGFSKMFSCTGLRVGFIACTEDVMKEILKVHQYNISCTNSISQYGILEGLKSGLYNVDIMKNEFLKRKVYVEGRLREMSIDFISPKGTFYIFPSIKKYNLSAEEFCERLLLKEKIACVPGSAFGASGEGYIRISYCYSLKELKLALDGLENFIKNL